jgi:putative glutamine amidotransferase
MTAMPLRIGITLRVEVLEGQGERRDCLDQRWPTLLQAIGALPLPLPNVLEDVDAALDTLALTALVLTGGNDVGADAPERDRLEYSLLEACRKRRIPVLGVCRGFQMMNLHLGGSLVRVAGHVRAAHAVEPAGPDSLSFASVASFHEFGIERSGLATELEPAARALDGTIEAARHGHLPWLGIMWHPERMIEGADGQRRLLVDALGLRPK